MYKKNSNKIYYISHELITNYDPRDLSATVQYPSSQRFLSWVQKTNPSCVKWWNKYVYRRSFQEDNWLRSSRTRLLLRQIEHVSQPRGRSWMDWYQCPSSDRQCTSSVRPSSAPASPASLIQQQRAPNAHTMSPCHNTGVVSASVSINVVRRERSWCLVAYPICRSVCLSVCGKTADCI